MKIKINDDGSVHLITDDNGYDRYYIGPNGESILEADIFKWIRILDEVPKMQS
jgi:hypothetical protein